MCWLLAQPAPSRVSAVAGAGDITSRQSRADRGVGLKGGDRSRVSRAKGLAGVDGRTWFFFTPILGSWSS